MESFSNQFTFHSQVLRQFSVGNVLQKEVQLGFVLKSGEQLDDKWIVEGLKYQLLLKNMVLLLLLGKEILVDALEGEGFIGGRVLDHVDFAKGALSNRFDNLVVAQRSLLLCVLRLG